MDEVAPAKKSVSSTLLLTVFLVIGLVIIVFSVRKFEADLAEANAAKEAEYAAEYAAFDAANPPAEVTTEEAVSEEVVVEEEVVAE